MTINPHLDSFTVGLTIINMAVLTVAIPVCVWAYRNCWPRHRTIVGGKGWFAVYFLAQYAVLMFTGIAPEDWARWARGAAIAFNVFTFVVTPIILVRVLRSFEANIDEQVKELRPFRDLTQ